MRGPDSPTYTWGEMLFDADERVIWVHGDQLEHNGQRVVTDGMTRAEVLKQIGRPNRPLKWGAATETDLHDYSGGMSVSLVAGRLVFATVKTEHYARHRGNWWDRLLLIAR